MIVEWFLDIMAGIQTWFLSLFGTAAPPEWINGAADTLTDVINRASGLGAWFPFPLMGAVAVFLLGLWLVLWSIKGARWLYGLTPISGGS